MVSREADGWLDLAAPVRGFEQFCPWAPPRAAYRNTIVKGLAFASISVVVLVVLLKGLFVESFFVPSSSMVPTIAEDDYILVPKFLYGIRVPWVNDLLVRWSEPKRGDVIVFTRRGGNRTGSADETIVKRVIALGDDVVEIVDSQVFLNGEALVEPYAVASTKEQADYHFGPYRVPKHKVFVLGDNRDNSLDSRAWYHRLPIERKAEA